MAYQFDFGSLSQYFGLFLQGTAVTVGLTLVAAVSGVLIAVLGAAASRSSWAWVRGGVLAYVELVRNTPFIVQMFFIFFGLPGLGLRLNAIEAAAVAMTINLAAYACEIIRSGIDAVPAGQGEAGKSLGLPSWLVFGGIVMPQALANIYPALTSQIIITMLESAVVSQIAVVDLTHVADLVQSRNFRPFETYLVVTVVYLLLAVVLRRFMNASGRRLFAGRLA